MTTNVKKYLGASAILAIASFGCGVYNNATAKVATDEVTLENVEAFTSSDVLNCEYKRTTETCEVRIYGDLKIDIFGIPVAGPDAEGRIVIDGVVVCSADGDTACKPIECIELYRIFRPE